MREESPLVASDVPETPISFTEITRAATYESECQFAQIVRDRVNAVRTPAWRDALLKTTLQLSSTAAWTD